MRGVRKRDFSWDEQNITIKYVLAVTILTTKMACD